MKVVAVIPCYNEERTIGGIVACAKKYADIVVVDGNSVDKTVEYARREGAIVVVNDSSRQGVGASIALGIAKVMEMKAEIVVTLDGDGQHDVDEIPKVAKPILESKADFVIGRRFMRLIKSDSMPRYRKVGNDVLTWLCNVGSREKVTDSQSGFRAYSSRLLKALSVEETSFGFCTEILVKARALGFRIEEVLISCIYHKDFDMNSTINPILQRLQVVWATVKWRVKLELLRVGRK